MARELEHLVKEQHTVVGEAHLAGTGLRASANESRARDRMMRRPKGACSFTDVAARKNAGNRMNRNYFECFLLGQRGPRLRPDRRDSGL